MICVENLQLSYQTGKEAVEAIRDVSLTVGDGEFVCVVGPSGAGKTTLLRCIAGLLTPTGGQVLVDGQKIMRPPPTMACVFQDYSRSLMPWLTVAQNVLLPLQRKGQNKKDSRVRVQDALAQVGIAEFGESYPWQLSGGMQQRAAIARALAYRPKILLMDEPFASVDAQTRAELEDLMLKVRANSDLSILFVTHDIDESVYLADRVIVVTARPSSVIREVSIDLPPSRDQLETKALPRFVELRSSILRSVLDAHRWSHTDDLDAELELERDG